MLMDANLAASEGGKVFPRHAFAADNAAFHLFRHRATRSHIEVYLAGMRAFTDNQRRQLGPHPNTLQPTARSVPADYLPDGQISHLAVQPRLQKYSASRLTQITSISPAIPSHTEGRFARSSRTLGTGCSGRCSVRRARMRAGRMMLTRTAKSCGPDAPTLASSWRSYPLTTVARKPGHRGEHEVSR